MGLHDNRRHHVSWPGSLIGLRGVARLGWRDVSGGCEIGFDARSTMCNVFTIRDANRRRDIE